MIYVWRIHFRLRSIVDRTDTSLERMKPPVRRQGRSSVVGRSRLHGERTRLSTRLQTPSYRRRVGSNRGRGHLWSTGVSRRGVARSKTVRRTPESYPPRVELCVEMKVSDLLVVYTRTPSTSEVHVGTRAQGQD